MRLFLLAFLLLSLTACAPRGEMTQERTSTASAPDMPDTDTLTITATVVYKNLEGGFWALDADDGAKYNPINLPETFQEDGLRVRAEVKPRPEIMSIHQYGMLVEIQSMVKLDG